MTDEEYAEYQRLVEEYNSLVRQNKALREEIAVGIENCYVVASNIANVGKSVTHDVKFLSGELDDATEIVVDLSNLLQEITEHYFSFKRISEASKKLSSYTDKYNDKFRFYNDLRRITLGYVIGLDSHIVSSENLRKKVEKAYLANTDYWLAYAIMAVMLWASNEKEAAIRALNKSLSMDNYRASVFFMLINLRFTRYEAAQNWYINLLEKTDVNNMQDEWQHVLHAYLIGAMKGTPEFNEMVESYFSKLMDQAVATSADFGRKVAQKTQIYAEHFIHKTESGYPTLKEISPDYNEMIFLQSEMEKIGAIAKKYDDIYQMEDDSSAGIFEQIENILYDLINRYDDEELKIIKEMKRNEAILASRGDEEIADKKIRQEFEELTAHHTFGDLMIKWAFSEDFRDTSLTIKRFALSYLKDGICNGFTTYFQNRYNSMKDRYRFILNLFEGETYEFECSEEQYDVTAQQITERFQKKKTKFIFADKMFKIFCLMGAGALVLLAIAGLTVKTSAFPVFLVLGIVLGVVSGFLVWRRAVDLSNTLAEKCRLCLVKLRNALDEMQAWRRQLSFYYNELGNLTASIERF